MTHWPSGTEDIPGFSLAKAVQDVSQHGYAQMETLREKENKLSSLQVHLHPYFSHSSTVSLLMPINTGRLTRLV